MQINSDNAVDTVLQLEKYGIAYVLYVFICAHAHPGQRFENGSHWISPCEY